MPKQVADKYYITHTINPGEAINETPLSSLADNQCPTYGQLITAKNNYYPINIKSTFSGDPIIDSNGHINTPVTNYTSNRLVSKEDITTTKTRRVDLEIIIQLQAAGGVVGYAAAGGKSVYFNNSIYWKVVNKNPAGPNYPLPCNIYLGQISVAIKGTNNFSIVQNTSSATVLDADEHDGYLNLHLNNPYAVSFPFAVTSKSDITLANVLTISPTSIASPYTQYFFTVRVDSN